MLSAEGKGLGGSNPLLHTLPRILDLLAHPSEVLDCLPTLSLVTSHSPIRQKYGTVGLQAPLPFTEVQLPVYHLCRLRKCYYDIPSLYSVSTGLSCLRESTLSNLLIQTTVRTR